MSMIESHVIIILFLGRCEHDCMLQECISLFLGLCFENGTSMIKSVIILELLSIFIQVMSVGVMGNPCKCCNV